MVGRAGMGYANGDGILFFLVWGLSEFAQCGDSVRLVDDRGCLIE